MIKFKHLLSIGFLLLMMIFGTSAYSQCTTYLAPDGGSAGYTNFNTLFGGAPCDDGQGYPIDQITTFEVYSSEAYAVENFIAGGTYEFNICEGPGAGSWVPEFAIVAPSGAIDAFGSGTDSCRIMWVASESGTYQIIINELGACGAGSNTTTDNGYPTLTCLGGAICPDVCTVWYSPAEGEGFQGFNVDFGGAPCDIDTTYELGDYEVWAAEAYAMDNIQLGGIYEFGICNGPGAGSWLPDFTIIAPSGAIDTFGVDEDLCSITWTASENGTYIIVINEEGECGGGPNRSIDNGFPSITSLGNTICDTTIVTCVAGSITSSLDMIVCGSLDSLEINIEGVSFPEGGGLGYNFVPGEGATGGNDGFFISNGNPNTKWNNDINGLLSSNGIEPLQGLWEISPFTYEDGEEIVESLCEFSNETVQAFFNADITLEIEDIGGGQAVVSATGGTAPYTYLWSDSDAQTADTLRVSEDGEYSVLLTDDTGCSAMASVMIMNTAVENLLDLENLVISPNPTNGQLYVTISLNRITDILVQVIDVNGKTVEQRNVKSSQRALNFDLSNHANGLYMVRVINGKHTVTQKVILAK